jgi:hypothetical protein
MSGVKSLNCYGRPPARLAVLEGIRHGLTAKETAYAYQYGLRAVQESARRMKVSFVYSGTGRPPKHPTININEHQ